MSVAELNGSNAVRLIAARVPAVIVDLVAYGLVSVLALACDYGLLLGLVAAGLQYLVAATLSFCAGLVVSYALSVQFVFSHRRALSREFEAAGFFAVGIVGLLLTQALLLVLVGRLGLSVAVAKIPTTGIVFVFNFLCRRSLVFVERARLSAE